jgi:hypothetical protein
MPVETFWRRAVKFSCYRLKNALAPSVEIVQFERKVLVEQPGMTRIAHDLSPYESNIVRQTLQTLQFNLDIGSNAM